MNRPHSARKTILFSGHDFRFLRPFIVHCENSPRYHVLMDHHEGHEITNPERCQELLASTDVIFCEWCLGNAVWYSHHKTVRQSLVIRLHAQEMSLPFLDRIHWDNVNALILICPRNRDLVLERFPFLQHRAIVTYNPIDCSLLKQAKLPGAEFNLGIMGISPKLKAPHLAFEILARLKETDQRYTLFMKGKRPRDYDWLWRRPEERAYYEKFYDEVNSSPHANSVVFETYGDDVPLWFSKIGFVLSTSDFEGSHQSVAEGMASGAIPVIRNWAGADLIYPTKYVVRTVDAAVEAVLKWRSSEVYESEMSFCRTFARTHFDQRGICEQLDTLAYDSCPSPPIQRKRETVGQASCRPRQGKKTSRLPDGSLDSAEKKISPLGRLEACRTLVLGYLPVGCNSGYRIRIEQEIRVLMRQGCHIHLACLHPEGARAAELDTHRAELARLGCVVHLVPIKGFFDVTLNEITLRDPLEALQRIAEENNIHIIHAEALYCARLALLLKQRRPSVRLVYDCHGTSPEEERLSGAHPARVSAMREWERRALIEADLNVFVSDAMHAFYQQTYGFKTIPHAVVPCCVAEERFLVGPPPAALRGLPTDRPILVYLGTLAAWQCGEEMIRLFAQLHRQDGQIFFLLLVPQADHQKAGDLMVKHSLSQSSVLLTELSHHEVTSALQRAHAGVLLRRAHPVNLVSSPTKFGEYLAAGVPVLMTNGIGDFSAIAIKHDVGLVLKSELLELQEYPAAETSRILEFVHQSRRQRVRIASACRRVSRTHLHWNQAATLLAEAYLRLLESTP